MSNAVAERMPDQIAVVRIELDKMAPQFAAALPKHIPPERFKRVVMTALQNNPSLVVKCSRQSLWNACMKAAQDGLLPDSREGAIVEYGGSAQWMPMIAGIRKKVRNSGEIATWEVHVVHANDSFAFRLGDDPAIDHVPTLADPGRVIAAYSIAVLKSGEKTREVMSVAAIEKVRDRSKAKNNGPWKTDYEEMCRKTVARRHSKVLPMSTDLDDLMRRDDSLYDMEDNKDEASAATPRPRLLDAKLDALANAGTPTPVADAVPLSKEPVICMQCGQMFDAEPEVCNCGSWEFKIAPEQAVQAKQAADDATEVSERTAPQSTKEPPNGGDEASGAAETLDPVRPTTPTGYRAYAETKMKLATEAGKLGPWYVSDQERDLRGKCGVSKAEYDDMLRKVQAREKELRKGK